VAAGASRSLRSGVRLGLTAAVATLALAVGAATAQAAQITVTPSDGLADTGQTVNVSGTGYAPTNTVFMAECTSVSFVCTATLGMATPDGSGNFGPTSINVVRTFGTGGAIDCNVEGCLLVANQPTGMNFANQPISFASGETLSLTPTDWDFGSVLVSAMSAPKTFEVTADGTGPVNISSVSISGDPQFVRSNDTCGGPLTPPDSCTLDVAFAPVGPGSASAQLEIDSDAPGSPHTAALSGTGATPPTVTPPAVNTAPTETGQRAAALKKCKKKASSKARKKCRRKARQLPL
jgi:hypothetical protein